MLPKEAEPWRMAPKQSPRGRGEPGTQGSDMVCERLTAAEAVVYGTRVVRCSRLQMARWVSPYALASDHERPAAQKASGLAVGPLEDEQIEFLGPPVWNSEGQVPYATTASRPKWADSAFVVFSLHRHPAMMRRRTTKPTTGEASNQADIPQRAGDVLWRSKMLRMTYHKPIPPWDDGWACCHGSWKSC